MVLLCLCIENRAIDTRFSSRIELSLVKIGIKEVRFWAWSAWFGIDASAQNQMLVMS